ncbi:dolichyldiphosphatase 1 [Copidosoma floridanum]|uniref:dolichyldiphosphatase 1 n=1 Tax=Copidosoma floridanum TaxID=29053 RepID=UPI0006C96BF9|nr:dolichyldiphosphatase 1 [Copidosoma floridanum]XP_014216567.1 dolichyldiphosphatase 1 [Copidosoma floridanum]
MGAADELLGEDVVWVPLSLTLIEYPQGDLLGKLLATISLMPFAVLSGFVTLILFRRDLHTIVFFGGVVINELLNYVLKHIIQEPRPMRRDTLYSEHGMPSTHAQFMWFIAAYMTLFVIYRLHQISEKFWRILIVLACIASALLVTYSRIYLQYHTYSQVTYGAIIGAIVGIAWFIFVHNILTPIFPVILTWKLSEYLLIRDTTLIPNILWFEYTHVRSEARTRRKLVSMKSQ